MFSGIIESLGTVISNTEIKNEKKLIIKTHFNDLTLGESVAINGVCLTVTDPSPHQTAFFLSLETCEKTNLGSLRAEDRVNLERALKLSDRLSGHLVQGHVDGTGIISKIESLTSEQKEASRRIEIELPQKLFHYCVEKGSITVNGVSLTVNSMSASDSKKKHISVQIIPHTWQVTQFHSLNQGDTVNVEIDCIAKYIERLCQPYQPPAAH